MRRERRGTETSSGPAGTHTGSEQLRASGPGLGDLSSAPHSEVAARGTKRGPAASHLPDQEVSPLQS